jgi:aminopeptidase N/puromycin-sensitive aminopeptidase
MQDVKGFFDGHKAPGAERTVKQSLEQMNNCVGFKAAQEKSVEEWLSGKSIE